MLTIDINLTCHLTQHFGEITKNVLDQSIPSLIVSFAVRMHAEQAMQRGRIFKERPLHMNWYIPNFVKAKEGAAAAANAAVVVVAGELDTAKNELKVGPGEVGAKVDGATEVRTTTPTLTTTTTSGEMIIKGDGDEDAMEESPAAILTADAAVDTTSPALVVVAPTTHKTEEEMLEDELIGAGAVEDELPSGGDVDDELRLDDEEDELESEDRSWRR